MSRMCDLSGRRASTGNKVSHANNKTRRSFEVNLQPVSLYSDTLGHPVKMRIANRTLRTVTKLGGLDAYLRKTQDTKLTAQALRLRKRIAKAGATRSRKASAGA